MTHPEELLAGYVDGTLPERERAVVDAHLTTCETCREEVALASRAVAALGELAEEPVPFGVMNPVTAEIGRRVERTAKIPWLARLQWVAGIAVAAALVAVVLVNLPHGTGQGGSAAREAAGGLAGASPTPGLPPLIDASSIGLESQNVDYDAASLESLASQAADLAKQTQTATAPQPAYASDSGSALGCLLEGSDVTDNDRLVRLIEARFQGAPAYLGVFLESPGAGQSPTQVVIWVVGKLDCSMLSFSSKPIR
jgi:hypothetical protein